MPETIRKELIGHRQISSTTIYGLPSIGLGLLGTGVGIFYIFVGLGLIPASDSKFHGPKIAVASIGVVFLLCGLPFFINGLFSIWRKKKLKRSLAKYTSEPWRTDYHWDSKGIRDENLKIVIKNFLKLFSFIIILVPFNWFALNDSVFMIFVIFFDLVFLGITLGYAIYTLIRFIKYGTTYLRFSKFPYFLGEKMRVYFTNTKPIKHLQDLKATIRFIEECYETRKTTETNSSVVVSYQLYAETVSLKNLSLFEQDGLSIPIEFQLPEGDYSTCLNRRPPRYWELEITGLTFGVNFSAAFFLPIYAKVLNENSSKSNKTLGQ